MPELDDCEEDDHFDPEDEWDDEVWARYAPEQLEQFKILGARLEKEEVSWREIACLQRVYVRTSCAPKLLETLDISRHGLHQFSRGASCTRVSLPQIVPVVGQVVTMSLCQRRRCRLVGAMRTSDPER